MFDLVAAPQPFLDGEWVAAGWRGRRRSRRRRRRGGGAWWRGCSARRSTPAIASRPPRFDDGPWPRLPFGRADRRGAPLRRRCRRVAACSVETVGSPSAGCPRGVTEVRPGRHGAGEHRPSWPISLAAPLEWEHNEVPLGQHVAGSTVRLSIRRYAPSGVVGAITPYNFLLITNVWKVVPALLAGCTVVLRPSLLTPLEATGLR